MKFLHGEEPTWITLAKVKAKARGEKRDVTMDFALLLDGYNTKKMPPFIREGYESMRKPDSAVFLEKIDRTIDSQNLYFTALPEEKQVRMEIEEADLVDLRLEKFGKKIYLFFAVTQEVGAELWKWVGQSFGREIAVRFEECQQELPLKAKAATA